jgi:hypothetical protein
MDSRLEKDIVDEIREMGRRVDRLERTISDLQSAHGHILADGTVHHSNSNVSCAKLGTGDYRITFEDLFDNMPPIVVLSISYGTAGALSARLHATEGPTTSTFRVTTFDTTTGAAADSAFEYDAKHP